MQKRYTRHHDKLRVELASLRKGQGITLAKIHNTYTIQKTIARALGADSHSITNSQIYSFLLTEIAKLPHTMPYVALRNALGLADDTTHAKSLIERRNHLASHLDKHRDTIIRYENQAINDLSAKLEDLDKDAPDTSGPLITTSKPTLHKRLDVQNAIIRDTAISNLAGLLPLADRAPELVHALEQSRRPYLEVIIEIKFLPSSRGDNWYRLDVKYVFTGKRDTFRLAVVMDSEDGERLLTQGLIDDFHKLNDHIDPRQEIRTIINNSRFTAYNHASNTQKLLRFSELEPDQADVLLQATDSSLKAQCRFLEIDIPLEWQSDTTTYEYRSTFNLRDDIHYAYWYAPSMMYLKKLMFDYSEFPQVDTWNFVTMPFLGNVTSSSIRHDHTYIVRPNSWIMPGHGIALMWEAKPID